jgi:hypothetical protein
MSLAVRQSEISWALAKAHQGFLDLGAFFLKKKDNLKSLGLLPRNIKGL